MTSRRKPLHPWRRRDLSCLLWRVLHVACHLITSHYITIRCTFHQHHATSYDESHHVKQHHIARHHNTLPQRTCHYTTHTRTYYHYYDSDYCCQVLFLFVIIIIICIAVSGTISSNKMLLILYVYHIHIYIYIYMYTYIHIMDCAAGHTPQTPSSSRCGSMSAFPTSNIANLPGVCARWEHLSGRSITYCEEPRSASSQMSRLMFILGWQGGVYVHKASW